jgi:hypothetical protein
MKGLWKKVWLVTLVSLAAVALGLADAQNSPPPGTLNYVEGQVSVQGQVETPKSVGSTYLAPDQEIQTQNGNAEMLLTPGVYLRLGHNSAVTMISPGLANTQVELSKGSAMLEVDELFKQNNLSVVTDNSTTEIEKQGLYAFSAQPGSVKVLDGKAVVTEDDRHLSLKKGHEALLAAGQAPVQKKFDKQAFENDPLYRWSMLRSDYATESNVNEGNALMSAGGWWGPGWYWDPYMWDFAFMPGFGMMWGPFGYPFFSPWAVGYAPYYGFYGHGYGYGAGTGFYHYPVTRAGNLPPLAHEPMRGAAGFQAFPHSMTMNRGFSGGGFRGGGFAGVPHGFGGGGFHGGGGGGHR